MKTRIHRTSLAAVAALAIALTASSASAVTVLLDFGLTLISNPAGDGKYWNSHDAFGGYADRITSTGAAGTWDLGLAFNEAGASGFGGAGINGPAGADPFDEANAIIDGLFSAKPSSGLLIHFSDLAPSTTYDFSAIGGRISNGSDGEITVNTGTGVGGNLLNNGTVLNFSVVSDASGVIELRFADLNLDSSDVNTATLNALSISDVEVSGPEIPTPAALPAGLALLSLAATRRRRA